MFYCSDVYVLARIMLMLDFFAFIIDSLINVILVLKACAPRRFKSCLSEPFLLCASADFW